MPVQWGLANPGGGFDYLASLQEIGQQQAQRQAMEQRQYLFDQQRLQDQNRVGMATRARGGDYRGARQEAALAGDFDFANALGSLDEDRVKRLSTELDAIGQLVPTLRTLPAEQRAAVGSAALARVGFSPEELADMDWSDAGLETSYQLSAAGKAALAARIKAQEETAKPRVIGDGVALVDGSGNVLYENQRDPRWQFDSESGSWLQEPESDAAAATPAPIAGGSATSTFDRMIQAESGGRQFTNGRVTTSPKGATGIAQVMPATGPEAARLAGLPWDSERFRTDPTYNRALGEAYFAAQLASFNGDPEAAAAAYNAGPGRVRQSGAPRTQGDWRQTLPAETRAYIAKVAPGMMRGGGQRGGPGVVNVRPPKARDGNAPSGYRFNGDRLEAIPGGPADPSTATSRNVQSHRKAEGEQRKQFDALPEVKTFKKVRPQFNTLRDLARKAEPTAQDDIAIIFNYMKLLDPDSVVREGEFATAQNAAGVPDQVRNLFNRAQEGNRLNPKQRQNILQTAYSYYKRYREEYNTTAENYRGYARDAGLNPDRVARTFTPDARAESNRMGQFKIVKVQ